ncbi:MAG: ABC transporter ATP-binding protein [Spirochaetia bacterium]|nr:ABC transporter ATP-binding protein [Spirochaetia bacterium]
MLRVDNIVKDYRGFRSFSERILSVATLGLYGGSLRFRALDGVSFASEAGKGEIIGLIGPNGAGKSTLLRILAGNSRAVSGTVQISGTIRSILELGVGFSSDLTARENVYYNGRLWGYSGSRLLGESHAIFDFAGLAGLEDRPLGTFSTGMQMRLAFALATFERSNLLLVDEALAVGDASFQQKCVARFQEFRDQGSVVLVVSHDLHMLRSVCDRMILLSGGRVVSMGAPAKVVEDYMELIGRNSHTGPAAQLGADEYGLEIEDERGVSRSAFLSGQRFRILFKARPGADLKDVTVGIHINDARGIRAFGTNSLIAGAGTTTLFSGKENVVEFHLGMNLGPGKYSAGCSVHRGRAHAQDCFVWKESLVDFEVESPASGESEGMAWMDAKITFRQ